MCVGYLWWCAVSAPPLFLLSNFRGKTRWGAPLCLRCRGRPQPCSRHVPAGLAVFFFGPDPVAHISNCNTRANPDSTAGSIKRAVLIFFGIVPPERVYATQPSPWCHRAPQNCDKRKLPGTCYGTTAVFICCLAIGVPSEISPSGAPSCLAAHFFVS